MAEHIRLQHVLRRALARAGIVTGFEHVCRRRACGFVQSTSNGELRRCPKDGRKLWPKAQVRPIRWHDLRHTTASLLTAAGVHLVDAQQILRHSDPRITQEVYRDVDLDQLRSAVNRMQVRIDNFPANVDGNVDGGDGRNGTRKKRNKYGLFEEREKGFEPFDGHANTQAVRHLPRATRRNRSESLPFSPVLTRSLPSFPGVSGTAVGRRRSAAECSTRLEEEASAALQVQRGRRCSVSLCGSRFVCRQTAARALATRPRAAKAMSLPPARCSHARFGRMKTAHNLIGVLFAVATALCATALASEAYRHASTVIVRSMCSNTNRKDGRKTVRVRWTRGSNQPERVTVWAYPSWLGLGNSVVGSDAVPHLEAKLDAPGFHDFTFSQLDHDHPQLVGVGADGYYDGEVFVDSGDIEVEVILQHKF